jgi:hypothetical protein
MLAKMHRRRHPWRALRKWFFTSHNRSVYVSGAVAPSGYEKPQSAYGLCAVFLHHIFASPGNLRFPLSGLQKRHIHFRHRFSTTPK